MFVLRITIPDPLSAGLITIWGFFSNFVRAFLSWKGRFGIGSGLFIRDLRCFLINFLVWREYELIRGLSDG